MNSTKIMTGLFGVFKVSLDIFVAVVIWLSCKANWIAFISVFYVAIFWVTRDIAVFVPQKTMTIIDMPEIKAANVIEHKETETAK